MLRLMASLSVGVNTFQFLIKGKNDNSSGYKFGMDFLELLPAAEGKSSLTGVYLLLL